jgi:hypothetical protein
MKQNIDVKGRILRGCLSLILFAIAGVSFYFEWPFWMLVLFAISGAFVAFEAMNGWCVVRACGVKTKI